jgi:hypothetical protein
VDVELGGGQLGVAEELLDDADVGGAFEHQRGRGASEQVTGAGLDDPRGVEVPAGDRGQSLGGQRAAPVVDEELSIVGRDGEGRPRVEQILLAPCTARSAMGTTRERPPLPALTASAPRARRGRTLSARPAPTRGWRSSRRPRAPPGPAARRVCRGSAGPIRLRPRRPSWPTAAASAPPRQL